MNELYPDFLYPQFAFEQKGEYLDWDYTQEQLKAIIEKEKEEIKKEKLWGIARDLFVQDGEPFELTPAQYEIFKVIVRREHPRVTVISSTQYGKSLTIARAVLLRMSGFPEDWLIVVPDTKRGKILLNYIIKDAAENEYFKDKLVGVKLEERSSMERLLEERSKAKLTFQVFIDGKAKYSSVEIITAEARRKTDAIEAIMGFGGRNLICLPFGEKILTDRGYVRIGEIVENKRNVKICSFNHKTNRIEFKKIEKYEKNNGKDLLEIGIDDKKIVCTEDHPIYIEGKGYIEAKDVKCGDKIWDLG